MKRIAIPIETIELCKYGCGNIAKYKNGSGNLMCEMRSTFCPAVKNKNSKGLKAAYNYGNRISGKEQYDSLPQKTKNKMCWSKGKIFEPNFVYGGKGNHKGKLIEERRI